MTASVEPPGGSPAFTEEEIRLIRLWSHSDVSGGRQVVAQVATFAVPVAFGIYGLATASLTVLGVAFLCVMVLLGWGIMSTYRDRQKYLVMQSICRKILPEPDRK